MIIKAMTEKLGGSNSEIELVYFVPEKKKRAVLTSLPFKEQLKITTKIALTYDTTILFMMFLKLTVSTNRKGTQLTWFQKLSRIKQRKDTGNLDGVVFAYKIRAQNIFYAPVIQISDENFVGTVFEFFVYINVVAPKVSLKIEHGKPPKNIFKNREYEKRNRVCVLIIA